MCGLVGFVSYKEEEELIKNLVNSIAHRGPDEQDYKIIKVGNQFIHFGSARLSVVGESTGRMPMVDSDNNMIVYNGELYDLHRLRNKISKNINSTSDTLHLFEYLKENDENNLNDLNGMFAFSFYNSKKNYLLLGRDKLGIKPIYYLESEEYPFFFSSEIKALLNFSNRRVNMETIQSYLAFGGFNRYTNFINDIKTVQPGSAIKWHNNNLQINNYYYPVKLQNENENNIESLLAEVIDDQLKADVSVDLLLSGGIDSSIIAYITKNILNKQVKAFSLSFTNKKYDETHKSKIISNELGIDHEVFVFDTKENESVISELLEKLPEPVGDPSIIPTFYLSQCVSKHTKAVLSGDGADELFSGYDWYRALRFSRFLNKYTSSTLQLVGFISDLMSKNQNISTKDKIDLFNSGINYKDEIKILHWQNTLKLENITNELFEDYIKNINLTSANNKYDKVQLIDLYTYLYTNILKKSDTASMLNGLEVRPVFLDDRILNYSLSQNQKKNVGYLKSKKELRKIAQGFTKVNNQKKQGFTHDFSSWVSTVGLNYLNEIKNDHKLISYYLNNIKGKPLNNTLEVRNIWKFYSLYKWIDLNNIKIESN